jgi:hypothetical protein
MNHNFYLFAAILLIILAFANIVTGILEWFRGSPVWILLLNATAAIWCGAIGIINLVRFLG